jgi:predicted phosphate transport protein (TIGR00153 family)
MRLHFRRPKKENLFLHLLRRQAGLTRDGVEALRRLIADGDPEAAQEVRRCERSGDDLRRSLVEALHKTFVTPFDREDIWNLSLYLDDVLDYADSTVREMEVLGVASDPHLATMVTCLAAAAGDLFLAMECIDGEPEVALEHTSDVKQRENQVESAYRDAVSELFSGPEDVHHIMEMLRRREVYRHVSNAADRADEAANVIGSVVVKMT